MPETTTISHREHDRARRAELLTAMIQLRSEALLGATVAAAALIAHADGEVAPAERRHLFALMRTDPLLSMFPRDVVAGEFATHARRFERDPAAAQAAALQTVAGLAGRPRHARVVLDACRMMTAADLRVHPAEIAALRRISAALGQPDEAVCPPDDTVGAQSGGVALARSQAGRSAPGAMPATDRGSA